MGSADNFRGKTPVRKALFILGALFLALYFVLGVVLLTVKDLPFTMSPALKTGFAILLMAYSVFRLARLVADLKNDGES